jgi:4-amino-4-deoxy-L-arabinose transferase-like glycosyltransferase
VPFSVSFIGADFLLTASALCYFLLLLRCFQNPGWSRWLVLGVAHAAAFLAKAFAMPWLTVSTLVAAVVANRKSPQKAISYALLALLIPFMTWTGWGAALQTKYGHFTSGYQSKWNLLDAETKGSAGKGRLSFFSDTSRSIDRYMVTDNIYPGSPLWNAQVDLRKLAPQAFRREVENLPEAFKQLLILITPGGGLAFLLTLRHLSRWERHNANTALAWIVTLNVFTLVGGYCMLVFDARYILPLLPLLIAFAVRFLLPSSSAIKGAFRRSLPSILFVASTVCLLFYWASPFRTMNRDYQVGVYSIASSMRSLPKL